MKKIISIFFCFLFLFACKSNTAKLDNETISETTFTFDEIPKSIIDSTQGAYLKLNKKKFDFGKIIASDFPVIRINVDVFNLGKSPLIILKADVSCGCVSVDFPKQPILSGEKAKLTISIDTRKQEGAFNKTVFLKSNSVNDIQLIRIIGKIKRN